MGSNSVPAALTCVITFGYHGRIEGWVDLDLAVELLEEIILKRNQILFNARACVSVGRVFLKTIISQGNVAT